MHLCQLSAQVIAHSATCNCDQYICASEQRPGTYLLELHDNPKGRRKV